MLQPTKQPSQDIQSNKPTQKVWFVSTELLFVFTFVCFADWSWFNNGGIWLHPWDCGRYPIVLLYKLNLLSNTFLWHCLLYIQCVSTFWVCEWNPKEIQIEIKEIQDSNESFWAVLSCDTVYYAEQVGFNLWFVDEILLYKHSIKTSLAVLSSTRTTSRMRFFPILSSARAWTNVILPRVFARMS